MYTEVKQVVYSIHQYYTHAAITATVALTSASLTSDNCFIASPASNNDWPEIRCMYNNNSTCTNDT